MSVELRAFAEQVLFGRTLEEKLATPVLSSIVDEHPGSPLSTPVAPGRPSNLEFKSENTRKSEFPGTRQLEQAEERGRLLHFFANHELLATELMALVLLKFPDAPAAFRRGVLQTLRDEQRHTQWYLQRMKACGIEFGELPVSGYFWRAVSPMESPMDYVAGLSLTFEQANLDFCQHFAKSFEIVGDAATGALLQKIYRDEIGHVAYGLKWFRRWKNPRHTDWEAFCRQLRFPLSPNRAKGFQLNVAGRLEAGLAPEFIEELNVCSQSKGRTPTVYLFNPFAEGYMAQGPSFTPVKAQAQLARDLGNLPQFLCAQDDVVVLERKPSVAYLSSIKSLGFPIPEFVELERGALPANNSLAKRKIGGLRPWAWGPDSHACFEPLFENVTGEKRSPQQWFHEGWVPLYSKGWSADFLRRWLNASEVPEWVCSQEEVGRNVRSVSEALQLIQKIRESGHHRVVLKKHLGLAGQSALRLWEPTLTESQHRWIENALASGQSIVVEPWLERLHDFSLQLEIGAEECRVVGYTGLINDARGQFEANYSSLHAHRKLPLPMVQTLKGPIPGDTAGKVHAMYLQLLPSLTAELVRIGFRGPLGIDALVYRDGSGLVKVKPIVEINPRFTMGRVTLELMRRVSQSSSGLFTLLSVRRLLTCGFGSLQAFAENLSKEFPLHRDDTPDAKIREGVVCVSDPNEVQDRLAVFLVSASLDRLLRWQATLNTGVSVSGTA